MKNIYYSLLFFGMGLCVSAQEQGGVPVDGVIPIKRQEKTQVPTVLSPANTTAKTAATQTYVGQPTGTSNEVGITEGQLSVSLSGAANYSIPIAMPAGINGVVPQVSLVYNSQGGNGLAGYGWNISGVSAITRIPRTKFHDGEIGGVNLDVNDRFALDGQRLILKTGTSYGASGSTYETENFSNLKITAIGMSPLGANFGPASFKVEYPDGSVAFYGNNVNSRSITTWGISYWENLQNVRIIYEYNLSNHNLNIKAIKYGTTGLIAPINEIKFLYKPRQRAEESYVGGQRMLMNTILSEIKVLTNNIGFRNYLLEHQENSLSYERLHKIFEKNGDGTKSYNPTVFGYEDTYEELPSVQNSSLENLGGMSNVNIKTVSGDFFGNEKMDFLIYNALITGEYWLASDINMTNSNTAMLHNVGAFEDIFAFKGLNQNNKVEPKQGWAVIKKTDINYVFSIYNRKQNIIELQYERVANFPTYTHNFGCRNASLTKVFPKKMLSGDFNGDGLTDVIAIDMELEMKVSGRWCSETIKVQSKKVYFIDLKRDITANFQTFSGELNTFISSKSKVEVADVNGDGKSDILIFENGSATTYTLNNTNQLVVLWNHADASISVEYGKTILLGDYNGDGKTDFLVAKQFNSDEWIKFTSTGTNFLRELKRYRNLYYRENNALANYYYMPFDHDKDGKTDLVLSKSTKSWQITNPIENIQEEVVDVEIWCYKNTDSNFSGYNYITQKSPYYSNSNFPVLPVFLPTGLGIQFREKPYYPTLEIAFLSNSNIIYFTADKDNSKDQLLQSVTTGNGVKDWITYQPLSSNSKNLLNKSIYNPNLYIETYPQADIETAMPMQVVSMIERQCASHYTKKQLFTYAGATSNLDGLGFLGFRASMRTNWFENQNQIISSLAKFNPNLRGANIENYTYKGYVDAAAISSTSVANSPRTSKIIINNSRTTNETVVATNSIRFLPGAKIAPTTGNIFKAQITSDFDANGFAETNTTPPADLISKSLSFYESSLSPTKVYKIQNIQSNNYNIEDNTSTETVNVFDANNNPIESINKVRNAGVGEQTTITSITYKTDSATPFVMCRPETKTQTVSVLGDTMTSKETYGYGSGNETNLLKTVEKWGHNTTSISETNVYDGFGNITKKTISTAGIKDRVTDYKYEPTGRFIEESYDIEKLKTTYVYNLDGTLKSEINPYGVSTSYLYDSWFKKIQTTDYLGKTNIYAYERIKDIRTIIKTTGDDGSYSEEIFDDLGRKIHTGIKDLQDKMSYKDYKYDIYDRNFSVSEPYYSVTTPLVYGGTLWSTTAYDIYGRPITATDFRGKQTSIAYGKLSTTTTDHSTLTTKKATKNAIGNLVQMEDTPGGIITYSHFANGNVKETNYGNTKISITQDGWGRKTSLTDPSAGKYLYEYNNLGEITKETTPNGTTTFGIDDWGKPLTKTIIGTNTNSSTSYVYNPTTRLIEKTTYNDNNDGGKKITTDYTYDSFKRPQTIIETMDYGAKFSKIVSYDAWGRMDTETSIAELSGKLSTSLTQSEYKNGFAFKTKDVKNPQNIKTLWETKEINARGQLTKATMGNGIEITNTYDSNNFGYLANTKQSLNTAMVMELTTDFLPQRGNLNWRKNSLFGNVQENFGYDSQDRLKTYPIDVVGTITTQNYEDDGRIKDNVLGTYNYLKAGKVYQNSSITASTTGLAQYQNNQKISYNSFKSPYEIEQVGIDKISFVYNDDNSRAIMFYGGLQTDKTQRPSRKYYSADGSMEIKQNTVTGAIEFITYLAGDGYDAPMVYKQNHSNATAVGVGALLYLHRDYQGSILAISNSSGQIVEKRLFDAWGSLIQLEQNGVLTPLPSGGAGGGLLLDRGYTGHEHLLSAGLIHMNGRLYDPKLHRFLQPDNFVQDPTNTQNYNRYGYCWNNPLKYTDPDGEWIFLVPVIIGAMYGTYQGLAMGAAKGATGWAMVGYALGGGVIGGVAGLASAAGGAAVGAYLSGVGITGAIGGGLSVGTAGAINGLISGFGMTALGGGSISQALSAAWIQGLVGAATGVFMGGVMGAAFVPKGSNIWNGKAPLPKVEAITIKPAGVVKTGQLEVKASAKLPNTTQTSTAPTTQNQAASKIKFTQTKNIDGTTSVKVEGINPQQSGTYSVYQGLDEVGNVKYIGITKRVPEVRFGEHLNSTGTGKEFLDYKVIDGLENLSKINARIIEQSLINQGKNNLLNIRNSIAPKYWTQYGIQP